VDSALEIRSPVAGRERMLCPCCGETISLRVSACSCGARFVGKPLDTDPIKVKRLEPALTSLLLVAVITTASLIFTKWFALGGLIVIWSAWRALRLARVNPEWYGGRRIAASVFGVAVIATVSAGVVALSLLPRYLENRKIRQAAATRAEMHHMASLLEDFKCTHGSYPRNAADIKTYFEESLPADYWDKNISYHSYTNGIADKDASLLGVAGLALNNFELRSAGPDGVEGTEDDLIMRDGVFLTSAEARRQPVPRSFSSR